MGRVAGVSGGIETRSFQEMKVWDKEDKLNEQIESEASAAPHVLTTITQSIHPVSPPSYSSNSNTSLPHRNVCSNWRHV